jgi:hypothetical protein
MELVISWTKQSNQDPTPDQRGWKKGRPRKYTDNQEEKILSIYYNLKANPSSFSSLFPFIEPFPAHMVLLTEKSN